MSTILVDGEPVELKQQPLTVLVHNQDMIIETPDHVLIGPEQTVKVANELEQDQWEQIQQNEHFLKCWDMLWQWDNKPPAVLAKASLASKHVAGMILMLYETRGEGKSPYLQYPETYLHPAQCSWLVSMISIIFPTSEKTI